jgi:hypothetical protein
MDRDSCGSDVPEKRNQVGSLQTLLTKADVYSTVLYAMLQKNQTQTTTALQVRVIIYFIYVYILFANTCGFRTFTIIKAISISSKTGMHSTVFPVIGHHVETLSAGWS